MKKKKMKTIKKQLKIKVQKGGNLLQYHKKVKKIIRRIKQNQMILQIKIKSK